MILKSSLIILALLPLLTVTLNLWDQCGGIGYAGSTQCPVDSTCVKNSDWWSSCIPNSNPTTIAPPISSTSNIATTNSIVSTLTTTNTPIKITTVTLASTSSLPLTTATLVTKPTTVAPLTSSVAPQTSTVAPLTSSVAPLTSSVAPQTSTVAPLTSSVAPQTSTTTGANVNCTDDKSCPTLSCTSLLATIMCPTKCQNVACKTTTTASVITTSAQILTTATTAKPITTTVAPVTTTTSAITDPIVPTFAEFTTAVTSNGYKTPTAEQYKNFVNGLRSQGGITTKREAAMFLANIVQESAGLSRIIEDACGAGCAKCPPPAYTDSRDYAGVRYCGRGYMQLSWSYNYKAASQDLYGDLRLWTNPDQVATNDSIAWATAFWFWKTNVHPNAQVQQGQFGASIKLINSGECTGTFNVQYAKKRYANYLNVMKAFNINETPIEMGCYN